MSMSDNLRERSPISEAVADEIRGERSAQRLTQNQLADASGVHRKTLQRIESGHRVADTTQFARICQALGLSLVEFYTRVEARV